MAASKLDETAEQIEGLTRSAKEEKRTRKEEKREMEERKAEKRKREIGPEIEIDLKAEEPPSKKTKRRAERLAKKAQQAATEPEREVYASKKATKPKAQKRKAGKPEFEKRGDHGIWIGNLSYKTKKDDLADFFTTKAEITASQISRIFLPMKESTSKYSTANKEQSKGFAYIDFDTSETKGKALKLTENLLAGRKVLIKSSSDFTGRPQRPGDDTNAVIEASTKAGHPPNRRVWVGNLSFETREEDLCNLLSQCGTILKIDFCTFEDTGRSKGFAFVDFERLEGAIAAVRGWIEIKPGEENDEDAEDDDEEGDEEKGDHGKQKLRKRSVKRLLGREIKVQFGEDAKTRYHKKWSTAIVDNDKQISINSLPEDYVLPQRQPTRKLSTPANTDPSVAHRTGQIVVSKGQKKTFT